MRVSELARKTGVTPAAVRYYSRIGLLAPTRDPHNGYRRYSSADARRVRLIRRAQLVGLTINDIRSILMTADHGETPCPQVQTLVHGRLCSIKNQLEELKATADRMASALATWEKMADARPQKGELCPLIERLDLRLLEPVASEARSLSP